MTFAVGEVWTLKPPMNAEARLRIGRIEGATVHISLWGVAIPPQYAGGPLSAPLVAGHLPISAEALRASVDARVDGGPLDDLGFEGGYETWRQDGGGVFTLMVPKIVDMILQTTHGGQASAK
jgi:hypothetical protein